MSYLNRVDEIITNQTMNIRCQINGSLSDITHGFKKFFTDENPREIKKFKEEWKEFSLDEDQDIDSIVTDYSDFLLVAEKNICMAAPVPAAARQVKKVRQQIARRHNVWERLLGKCENQKNCFDVMKVNVKSLILKSDPRDLHESDAKIMALKIKTPKNNWFSWTFKREPYEEQLLLMHQIIDSINIASTYRLAAEVLADKTLKEISDTLIYLENKRVDFHSNASRTRSYRHNKNMVIFLNELISPTNTQINLLKNVTPIENAQSDKLKTLISKADKLKINIVSSINHATTIRDYRPPETHRDVRADIR